MIEIPAGRGGINRGKNLDNVPITDLSYLDGLTCERDLWEKETGAAKINSVALTGSAAVKGGCEFTSAAGVTELIAYIDTGSAASVVTVGSGGVVKTIVSGLTTGGFPCFAEGWDGTTKALYFVNGLNTMQVYTGGATSSNIPSGSSDWSGSNHPSVVVAHQDRMVAFGNANFPHQLYLSVPGEHGNFTGVTSAIQRVYPGTGQKLVGAVSWRNYLYMWKYPRGIYILDDSDPNVANWRVSEVTKSVGGGGLGCVLPIEDDILFLGADAFFYALSQVRSQGQINVPPLSPLETAEFIREELNVSQLSIVQSVWYGHKRKAMFVVPATGATTNNRRVDIDFHEAGQPRFHFSRRDTCPSIWLRRATATDVQKPVFGDSSGFVWAMEQSTRAKDGAGFRGQYETPAKPLYPNGSRRGNLKELEVVMDPQGNWDLTVEVHRDGELSQTLAFSMQSPGAAASSISLDSDVIAGNTVANKRERLFGDARYIKLIGRNNTLNENFAIASHIVKFSPGNNR